MSVYDATWTTDREGSARRWQELHPALADGLDELIDWSTHRGTATTGRLAYHLNTTIDQIVRQFATDVGLWPT